MRIRLIGYARNVKEQAYGLQGRVLAPGEGMLFIFSPPRRTSFWMLGVLVPLDIVFMDKRGRVTGAASMTPGSTDSVFSPGEIGYALEVPAGTVNAAKVRPGQAVKMTAPNVVEIGL